MTLNERTFPVADQFGIEHWFPAVSEDERSGTKLLMSPRYMIPQRVSAASTLADPCIFAGRLPEWVVLDAGYKPPFAADLISRRLTPVVVWVSVTPRVRAWVRKALMSATARGPSWDRMRQHLSATTETYCRQHFAEEELATALAEADDMLRRGDPLADLLPKLDGTLHHLVRYGLMAPWDGYEGWARQFEDAAPPPPSQPPPAPPKARSTRRAAAAGPDLF
jgi:hypothetical protein